MNGKTIAFGIWTLIVIIGLIFVGIENTKDQVYTGTKLEFTTGRDIQIDADNVTFEAASSEFFVLRKTSGETITGISAPRPLGWTGDQYFVAEPQGKGISGGKWLFPLGSATIRITSDKPVTVRLLERDAALIWLVFSVIAILFWVLGLVFIYG